MDHAIILAAGVGSRMNSANPHKSKLAYEILGKPVINYVLDTVESIGIKDKYVVVGHAGKQTSRIVGNRGNIVWQKEILGTGHAVAQCKDLLKDKEGLTLIVCGDMPMLTASTVEALFKKHKDENNDLTLISCLLQDPTGYGRVVREKPSNKVLEVINRRDWKSEYDFSYEVNSGIYLVDNKLLFEAVSKIEKHQASGHYFLTEIVKIMKNEGHKIAAYVIEEANEVFSIYDRAQLAYAEKILRKRINRKLMLSGVSIEDPETTYISSEVEIGKDTIIRHNTTILGNSKIGSDCYIGPNTYIESSTVGNDTHVVNSYLLNANIDEGKSIGPFAVIKDDKQEIKLT
jgi:bifunctional UDP-N-acetylglucosamine pyrophosphorylase/glucosamine-1-phosphate N-acetyltransferase